MTTRGTNQSISPPVQIPPQQRHVSAISSGTPPPNPQLYPGQSPGLVQGPTYSYIQGQYPQGEQLLPYQAYGSAPNDLRAASTGRGAPGPNMAQGGTYYHQGSQNMRPSQPPPPSHAQHQQQYYHLGQPGQNTMRHPRPTHPSNPMFLLQQNNNMIISANMYQPQARLPMYTQGGPPQYAQPYQRPGGMVYYANGVPTRPSSVPMQAQGMGPPPAPRERRLITISDPNTGQNITEELLKSQHQQTTEEKGEHDDSPANDKGVEIRKSFTRQVVERMKTGEAAQSSNQPPLEMVNSSSQAVNQSVNPPPPHNQASQEHHQHPSYPTGPPQQPQSTPPLTGAPGQMMRPPNMRMASPAINLSIPPPQLPPNMVNYNPRHPQNQQAMPGQVQSNMSVQTQQQVMPPKGPPPSSAAIVMVDPSSSSRSVEPTMSATHETHPVVDRKPPQAHAESVIPHSDIPTQKQSTVVSTVPLQHQVESPSHTAPEAPSQSSLNQIPKASDLPAEFVPAVKATSTVATAPSPTVGAEKTQVPASVPVSTLAAVPTSQPSMPTTQSTMDTVPAPSGEVKQSKPESVKQPSPEPVKQPTPEPVKQKTPEPAKQPSPEPVKQPSPEPVKQPSPEPVKQPSPEPVKQKTPEPMVKQPSVEPEVIPPAKEDAVSGASTQGNKDGKKGKKNKKDFGRKESGGSDMDAFIVDTNSMKTDSTRIPVTTNGDGNSIPEIACLSKDESITQEVTNNETVAPPSQVESKNKNKKKKKKKGKKSAPSSSKAPVEETVEDSSEHSQTASEVKGKDSGVDSESSQTITVCGSSVENVSHNKDNLVAPNTVVKNAEDKTEIVIKESSPVAIPTDDAEPVKESSSEKNNAEQETTVTPVSVKNQNGTELSQNNRPERERQTSVPKDNNNPAVVINSVPVEEPVDKPNDVQQSKMTSQSLPEENGENGTPKIEEVEAELSKAETFAKLKKNGGKLVYPREYLMELRECASSQTKPEGLPELEIIMDRPNPAFSRSSGGPADFTPAFFQTATNQRHAPPIGKSSSRGRQRPDGGNMGTPRVIKSISMSSDSKPLHTADNPWKAPSKKDKEEEKTLSEKIIFIMNRLTPTNFEKMAGEMKKLDVKTYEDLQLLVNIYFDKVTLETKFVEAYAQLCKVMSGLKVPPPTDGTVKEHMATFRVVMLTKCQQEFEADKAIIFEAPEEKKKKLEAENPVITPERNDMIEKTLYHMKLKRMKFYGNIRFIGELFKLGMLTESIMHDCIFRLLKARDDDSLVSLCNLLTTVGRNLDTDKAKPRMDQYFSQMSKIADERKSRIKFTLRDVLELRLNHWVPRKEATGPKKIDEVHKDFAQEQARNQFLATQPLPPRNDNVQPGSRRGSRQRPDDNKPNEDGWNMVSSKAVRMIDASKMKISKNVVDDNIQLGPGGGGFKQSMWSRGSHGGAQPSQDDRSTAGSNRFSALTSDDARRSFPRSPSRGEGSAGRSLRQGPTVGHGRGKIMSRSSQEGERRDAIASVRSFRSQNSSRDNSWNRDDRRQMMGPKSSWERDNPMTRSDSGLRPEEFRAPAPPAVKQMSESEIETKAVNILDEYLNIRDLSEAKLCLKELTGQNHLYLVVTASINNVLEKREEARHLTGNLFHELVSNTLLAPDVYVKGLNGVLEYASDMVVDIPTLWNCLGHVICPLLVGGSLSWSKLKPALSPHLDNKDGAKLIAAILSQCAEKQGEKDVAHHWQNSGLSWSAYLKADEIETFVKDRKLDFTLGAASSSGSGPDKLTDVERMIRGRASNEELIAYIEKTIPSKSDSSFIRALTTAFVNSAIAENKNILEDVIKSHKGVLQRYIGNNVDLQLQALYAIQTLIVKLEHPSGVLQKLFELLYDEGSIEEEAFDRWEKSNDPQEQDGKGTCVLSCRQFFIWLRENEDPES